MKELTETPSLDRDAIIEKVRKQYPGMRLFAISHQYGGLYIIKQQTLADVRDASTKLKAFVEKKIAEAGGQKAISAMSEEEQVELQQQINGEYADYSNEIVLSQCVVYPENFAELLKEGNVPGGIIPFLLEHIMEVSCWGEAEVQDI